MYFPEYLKAQLLLDVYLGFWNHDNIYLALFVLIVSRC